MVQFICKLERMVREMLSLVDVRIFLLVIICYINLLSEEFEVLYSSTIFNNFYNEYPSIAVDNEGKVWIAATGLTAAGEEAIFLTMFYNNNWWETQQVSTHANQEFNPKIFCDLE
ncbi:MAG: hypothetical protein NZ839_02855, partial [Endomicrobia bacterium]|nr:hypothetical protein [Endomicrobiia bacterium]